MAEHMNKELLIELLALGRAQASTKIELPDGKTGIICPVGYDLKRIDNSEHLPDTIRQTVAFDDEGSFCTYVNRFKLGTTTLFGDIAGNRVSAIIDYHGTEPQHCLHVATLNLSPSVAWDEWCSIDGKAVEQVAFAEFVEERAVDIVSPSAADLLEIATNLKSKKSVHFDSGVQLQSGDVQLTYHEETEAKGRGTLAIPQVIEIGVPVYFGSNEAHRVRVFFRYRLTEGKLRFACRIHNRKDIQQDAFNAVCSRVSSETSSMVLLGKVSGL